MNKTEIAEFKTGKAGSTLIAGEAEKVVLWVSQQLGSRGWELVPCSVGPSKLTKEIAKSAQIEAPKAEVAA